MAAPWRMLVGALLLLSMTPLLHVTKPATRPLDPDQAWAHNIRVMQRRCRHMVPWPQILREFERTVQYDDVRAHKACQRARGCRHGHCARPDGTAGCLNRAGTRCCDQHIKRCVNLS